MSIRERRYRSFLYFILSLVFCGLTSLAQSPAPAASTSASNQAASDQPTPPASGAVSGSVVDQSGNAVVSARVKLTGQGQTGGQEMMSDADGYFLFSGVPAGAFEIRVDAGGFATKTMTGIFEGGETLTMPEITLAIAATVSEIRVGLTKDDLAEEQVKIEEKQRVLGFIPNFYVSYDHNAPSLSPKQKFELAWRSSVDPVTFLASGAIAGLEQGENTFPGYGQGAQGYAKRYGAAYADGFIGTMIGGAILPSLFKQDPRYFYKGTGNTQSRILYALANAVICKGDNGHWQTNYSGILGSLAAGGISNLYYPASSRDGAQLTFEGTLLGIAFSGASNLFQEFLIRKLTPHVADLQSSKP